MSMVGVVILRRFVIYCRVGGALTNQIGHKAGERSVEYGGENWTSMSQP